MVHLGRDRSKNIRLIVILSCHSESVYDGSFFAKFHFKGTNSNFCNCNGSCKSLSRPI